MKEDSSHTTRFSDSSLYDYICTKCGATDAAGDDRLHSRCPNSQMDIRIIEGQFVITVGVNLAIDATMNCADDCLANEFDVVDKDKFASEILSELRAEAEDGTNLIHRAFDKAALKAVESGATGVTEKRP
ncbi:hypothetical protein KAR91_40390 [Candidatus Pacearchaeota archaeon]|nr:hypothetical protein [Candidatus Pacearchaeota archaeon]